MWILEGGRHDLTDDIRRSTGCGPPVCLRQRARPPPWLQTAQPTGPERMSAPAAPGPWHPPRTPTRVPSGAPRGAWCLRLCVSVKEMDADPAHDCAADGGGCCDLGPRALVIPPLLDGLLDFWTLLSFPSIIPLGRKNTRLAREPTLGPPCLSDCVDFATCGHR